MRKFICVMLFVVLCLSLCACGQEEQEYTITFYNNKGIWFSSSGNMIADYQDSSTYKVIKCREHLTEPAPPTNKGYVFLGWYQNPECTDKFLFGHYEVNGDINLYAKWGKSRQQY